MTEIKFVPVEENDVMTMIELRRKIWTTTYRGIYPDSMLDEFDYEWHREKELQRTKSPDYFVSFIVKDKENIGYLTLRKSKIMILQSLYIRKEYQQQGIGTKAFDFVKDYCVKNGMQSFVCHCVPQNYGARAFYEKMGGKVVGQDLDNEESWMNSIIYRFDF